MIELLKPIDIALLLVVLAVMLLANFIPTVLAKWNKHRRWKAIFILNGAGAFFLISGLSSTPHNESTMVAIGMWTVTLLWALLPEVEENND